MLAAVESSDPSLHGHGHGHFTILDQSYRHIKQLYAGHHEREEIQVLKSFGD